MQVTDEILMTLCDDTWNDDSKDNDNQHTIMTPMDL
jgi:hypothetical protein